MSVRIVVFSFLRSPSPLYSFLTITISSILLSENHYLIYTLIRVSPFPYTPFLKSPPSSHHFPETRAVTAEKCGNRNPVDYVRGTHRIPANADVT